MAIKIKEIIKVIKRAGVVVCPTDTVYGLIADATSKKAVEKVFKIKNRNRSKFLPIFVKNIKMAKKFAYISKDQEKILRKKWPGKFTFVLKRRKAKIFGVDKKTIALRIPDYKLINTLLKKINKPLTGTSANISGRPASTKIEKILEQFENHPPSPRLRRAKKIQPDLIIDTGNFKKSKPSKVVDLTKKKPKVLRS